MTRQQSDPGKNTPPGTRTKSQAPTIPAKVEKLYCGLLGKTVTACPTEGTENCSTC